MWTQNLQVAMSKDGVVDRRGFLRNVAVGTAAGVTALSWMDQVRAEADNLRKRGMACILLFMRGGPSQFETFDPKPGVDNGGPTKAIDTAVNGIQIAEGWEKVAKQMKEIALIRSMTNKEGNHDRAVYNMHTGYLPSGSIKYPNIGSIIACELCDPAFDLPHFVNVGGRGSIGSGFLGMQYAPFVVQNPNQMPINTELPGGVSERRLTRRLDLLNKLEDEFAEAGAKPRVEDHKVLYQSAAQMIVSPKIKAFDISQEKDSLREKYGKTTFGQGCLLARRLVETGVTCVEVTSDGWDTHEENFDRVKTLAGPVDAGFAALVEDLKERKLLDTTLVIWMGEFGRTPQVNGRKGRDHYPRAFSVALAGGGIKGGQVIGKTDKNGSGVTDKPVTVPDIFCSFCEALKINPKKENRSGVGRPIKIVDGGQPVKDLFA